MVIKNGCALISVIIDFPLSFPFVSYLRVALTVPFLDTLASAFSGVVVFATIGHISHRMHLPIETVTISGTIAENRETLILFFIVITEDTLSETWGLFIIIIMFF